MRVYLAGPMAGIKQHNFPAFQKAADELMDAGYTVWDSASFSIDMLDWEGEGEYPEEWSIAKFLLMDLEQISLSDAIVLLPGWEHSEGVALELHLAKIIKKPVMTLQEALLKGEK